MTRDAHRTLSVGSVGPAVRALHARLLDVGVDVGRDELVAGLFGHQTRHALLEVQRGLDLAPTGAADSETLARLEKVDAPRRRYVVGRVLGPDERGVGGARVAAFDRDLRSAQGLGATDTDDDGAFVIAYGPQAWSAVEAAAADVYVQVSLGRRMVHDPPIEETVFNAPALVAFVVRIATREAPDLTEWQRLERAVEPLLGEVAWTDLAEDREHRDLAFLTGETGFAADLLTAAVLARRLGAEVGIEPQFFYAVLVEGALARAGRWASLTPRLHLTTSLALLPLFDDIVLLREEEVAAAVEHAAATFRVDPELGAKAADFWWALDEHRAAARERAAEERRRLLTATLTNLVEADVAGAVEAVLADDPLGDLPSAVTRLLGLNLVPTGPAVDDSLGRLSLAELLGHDDRLIDRVRAEHGISGVRDLHRLAALGADDWARVLADEPGAEPGGRAGGEHMTARMAARFPTSALAARLARADAPTLRHAPTLAAVLAANPEFDLARGDVRTLFAADETGPAADVVGELRSVQRVFRLAPSADATASLLGQGVRSGAAITGRGRQRFIREAVRSGALDATRAAAVFDSAADVHAAALLLAGDVQATASATLLPALAADPADPAALVAGFPNMKSLFSTIDMCECPDCRSVHGAAAYLVDVLQFLGDRLVVDRTTTPAVTLKGARDVLLARRPDLSVTDLNCSNTNTSVPYLDLVCELLEEAVAPDPGAAYAGAVADGPIDAQLLAALQGAGLEFTTEALVYGPDLDGAFVARDARAVVGIRPDGGGAWRIRVLRQTFGTDAELAAAPGYVHAPAYAALAADPSCFTLPFDLGHAETRAYFRLLDAERADLMAALAAGGTPTAAQVAAERLGLSEAQRLLVASADVAAQPAIWTTPTTPAATTLEDVDRFVTRSGRTYAELLELLDLEWIDGGSDLFVQHLDSSANLAAKRIVNLDDAALDRIHRFLRLRAAIGWSSATLDRALRSPRGGAGTLDDACLVTLAALLDLSGRLGLSVEATLDLLEPVDIDAATGPYARTFLDPIRVGTVEPALVPDAVHANEAAEAAVPGSGITLSAVVAPLALALGRSVADTNLLIAAAGDPPLTEASLGAVLGRSRLASALRLPVGDLLDALALEPADPLDSVAECSSLVARVALLRASGVPIALWRYLLRHEAADLSTLELPAERVTALLDGLHAAYVLALEADASPFDPDATPFENAAAIRPFLARLGLSDGALASLQTLLTDTWTDPGTSESAFVVATLGPVLETTAILAALAARSAAAEPKDPERNDLIAAVAGGASAALYAMDRRAALETAVLAVGVSEELAPVLLDRAHLHEPPAAGGPLLADVLLSDDVGAPATELKGRAVRLLHTTGLLFGRLGLWPQVVAWLLDNAAALGWLEPDRLPYEASQPATGFNAWQRLYGFVALLAAYPDVTDPANPDAPRSVTGFFDAALAGSPVADLLGLLGALAGVDPAVLSDLDLHLGLSNPDTSPYRDPATAVALLETAALLRRLGLDVPTAVQVAAASPTLADALRMRAAVRSRYAEQEWLGVLRQVQDPLREAKRDALVGWLLAHDPTLGSVNDVYDRFLIDTQMTAGMSTSRIVQAHATVQLFAMRCLMGLEPESVASVGEDDGWLQWETFAAFRVWEANRKIFLWPENWLSPDLRDDRSEPFVAATDALSQDALTTTAIEAAAGGYLRTLEDLAHLEVRAAYYDAAGRVEHVFARTRGGDPYVYYHREFQRERAWTPWTTVPLDIGPDQLLAFSRNSRLTLAWPEFLEEPDESAAPPDTPDPASLAGGKANERPGKRWKIHLAVSEYADGRWQEKRVSASSLTTSFVKSSLPASSEFNFFLWGWGSNQAVTCFGPGGYLGSFALTGCKGVPEAQPGGSLPLQVYPRFVDTELLAGLFVEESAGSGELAVVDALSVSPAAILQQTGAGRFSVAYPLQMTILDWILLLFQVWSAQAVGATGARSAMFERYLRLPLGTLLPWFYGDLARGFVVVPGFYPRDRAETEGAAGAQSEALKKTAADALDVVEDVLALVPKYVAKIQADPSVPLADRLAELQADPDYLAIVEEVRSYGKLRYGLQILPFYHALVCKFRTALNAGGIPALMARELQLTDTGFDFEATYDPGSRVVRPYPREDVDFAQAAAYSSYNWELFYHLPMAIADRLRQDQQFDEARSWLHYVFNPVGAGDAPSPNRFWNTKPFYLRTPAEYLAQRIDTILGAIAADPSGSTVGDLRFAVTQWREDPFRPHVVARSRPVAYQVAAVLAYVDTLIEDADHEFRMFTRESVNKAIQKYVLADKLLGAKPRIVPPAVPVPDMTYDQLRGSIDIFGNALLDLENLVPDLPSLPHGGAELPPPPATLTSLYFCIPPNERLLERWDVIADRLFKIRHCQNIDGIETPLALFSPPIDPGALARAVAAGADVSSFLAGLGAPAPHYRFVTMSAKATELAQHVASLGADLLGALEKRDAEALARLRQDQEIALLDALRTVKLAAVEEAEGALAALESSRAVVQERIDYYSSREYMNAGETTAAVLAGISLAGEAAVALGYALAGGLKAIPTFVAGGSGFGGSPTVNVETGGQSFGDVAEAAVSMLGSLTRTADKGAGLAATQGGYQRRMDDWNFQADLARREAEQLAVQVANARLRLETLAADLQAHDLQTANAEEVRAFMHARFTGQELFNWTVGQVTAVYYKAYQLAYDMAKRAERSYGYELASDTTFIKFGYWNSLKKGLLAAQGLLHDIKRMEAAYLNNNAREYELTKHVSLGQIDPGALWQLRTTGSVTIQVPEAAFDLDHPNMYLRRIKTVSTSLVCNAAPYATVGMTLTLVADKYRRTPKARTGAATDHDKYAEEPGNDDRFAYNVGGISSVATSSAVSDSGLFELNFHDERYLPFEGAGAISTWRIELPSAFPAFDHSTISDLVLHLRYTAREGGSAFRSMAQKALASVLNETLLVAGRTGLHVAYSLRDGFPNEWWQLTDTGATTIVLDLDHLPFAVRGHGPALTAITWAAQVKGGPPGFAVTVDGAAALLNRDPTMKALCIGTVGTPVLGTPIDVACDPTDLEDLSILVAYTIT